jgi:hypothetical protein
MNASLSSPADLAQGDAPALTTQIREALLDVPGTATLHHGANLEGMRTAWRLIGPAAAAVVTLKLRQTGWAAVTCSGCTRGA